MAAANARSPQPWYQSSASVPPSSPSSSCRVYALLAVSLRSTAGMEGRRRGRYSIGRQWGARRQRAVTHACMCGSQQSPRGCHGGWWRHRCRPCSSHDATMHTTPGMSGQKRRPLQQAVGRACMPLALGLKLTSKHGLGMRVGGPWRGLVGLEQRCTLRQYEVLQRAVSHHNVRGLRCRCAGD